MSSQREFRPGDTVHGTVRKALAYRAFVEVDDGAGGSIVGTIPAEEYFWSDEQEQDYTVVLCEGRELDLKVLSFRRENDTSTLTLSRRCALLREDGTPRDPWDVVPKNYRRGQLVSMVATHVAGNRVFGEIVEGVRAVVEVEELRAYLNREYNRKFPVTRPAERFQRGEILYRGDKVAGIIIDVNTENRLVSVDVVEFLGSLDETLAVAQDEPPWMERKFSIPLRDESGFGDLGVRRVILADDDEPFCRMVRDELSTAGVEVLTFLKPEEVSDFLGKNPLTDIDAFIIDMVFGDDLEAGLRICEEIRRHSPRGMIVLTTGRRIDAILERIGDLRIHDILPKPFTLDDLYSCLRNLGAKGRGLRPIVAHDTQWETGTGVSLEARLRARLLDLVNETQADAGALFSYNPLNERVELLAWVNEELRSGFRAWREHMYKSPIRDILLRGEVFDGDKTPRAYPGKFVNFARMFGFSRTIGRAIDAPAEIGHCFFLFYRGDYAVRAIDVERARRAAAEFRGILMDVMYSEWAEERQSFFIEGKLLSEFGHELSTKLVGLPFYVKQLKDAVVAYEGDAGRETILGKLRDLGQLCDETIELGKKLTGLSGRLDVQSISLEDALRRIVDFAKSTAAKMRIRIVSKFSGDLPPVYVGRSNIQQVFLNVILNALLQTDSFVRRRGLIEVSTEYRPQDDFPIKVRVKDTGIGIHEKDYARIFQPLYTTRSGGHGMGLAISRSIMETLGGRIAVEESYLYEGTTFVIALPAKVTSV